MSEELETLRKSLNKFIDNGYCNNKYSRSHNIYNLKEDIDIKIKHILLSKNEIIKALLYE